MKLQDAIDTLADGDELREMTRHNATDFVQATAVVVDAARQVANGTPTYLVYTRQDDVGYLGHIYQGSEASRMSGNPNLPGEWFTALDIGKDTDGD